MKTKKRISQGEFLLFVAAASAALVMQLRTHSAPGDTVSAAQTVTCSTQARGVIPARCEATSDRDERTSRGVAPGRAESVTPHQPQSGMWV